MSRRGTAAAWIAGTLMFSPGFVDACPWPHWDAFKAAYISEDGRVIDTGSPRQHTVSEGQAYALFFALVANDRPAFDRLLQWTEDNLARGDFSRHLPAWLWGRDDEGSWRILDDNPASDADLWIAYTLAEAARLWDARRYRVLARIIGRRILSDEVAALPGLGQTLLPAPVGFVEGNNRWRLNPSYVPLQIIRGLARAQPDLGWSSLLPSSVSLIRDAAPQGYAPDWVVYDGQDGFLPDAKTQALGSYDAIRVYLWVGMMSADDPLRDALLAALRPMADATAERGAPPEQIDTRTGQLTNDGNAGFSASLLPMLRSLALSEALQAQRDRLRDAAVDQDGTAYYTNVLALFAEGWDTHHYAFAADGRLTVPWTDASCDRLY